MSSLALPRLTIRLLAIINKERLRTLPLCLSYYGLLALDRRGQGGPRFPCHERGLVARFVVVAVAHEEGDEVPRCSMRPPGKHCKR